MWEGGSLWGMGGREVGRILGGGLEYGYVWETGGGGKALGGLSGRRIALERRTDCMLVSRQQEPEVY